MQLQVGKTYRHSKTEIGTDFRITRQWNASLFEGVLVTKGKETNYRYMFSSTGTALGYPDFAKNSHELDWCIVEIKPQYEVVVLFDSGSVTDWQPLTYRSLSSFSARYAVREKDKQSTMQLLTHDEAKVLLA